ncbi:MAG TPA: hypothetical protein VF764_00745, partial [Steroidobacteraceae bacterium]
MTGWLLVTASLAIAAACALPECATAAVPASAGESIYLRGVLDVLEHYIVEQHHTANRPWQLHVWQLAGPATTWRAQLEHDLQSEPVFAVLSGLAGSNWRPVHE